MEVTFLLSLRALGIAAGWPHSLLLVIRFASDFFELICKSTVGSVGVVRPKLVAEHEDDESPEELELFGSVLMLLFRLLSSLEMVCVVLMLVFFIEFSCWPPGGDVEHADWSLLVREKQEDVAAFLLTGEKKSSCSQLASTQPEEEVVERDECDEAPDESSEAREIFCFLEPSWCLLLELVWVCVETFASSLLLCSSWSIFSSDLLLLSAGNFLISLVLFSLFDLFLAKSSSDDSCSRTATFSPFCPSSRS